MEEEDNIDMAAAMGFSSFGGTKKRKFDHASSPKAKADASGANSTKLGVRTKKVAGADEDGPEENQAAQTQRDAPTKSQATGSGLASFLARGQNLPEPPLGAQEAPGLPDLGQDSTTEMMSFGGPPVSRAELNALRNGVQNEHGDTAYFLPSFVEDPWSWKGTLPSRELADVGILWRLTKAVERIFKYRSAAASLATTNNGILQWVLEHVSVRT